jgi:hypothetical protein
MATNQRHSIATTDEHAFNGHNGLNPDASFGDLLLCALYHAEGRTLAEQVTNIVLDNLAVIGALSGQDEPLEGAVKSLAMRTEWLMKIAPELQARIDEAGKEIEQHEIDDWDLFRVPTANGVPQFEHAREATSKDFNAVGFVYRNNVLDAIGVLLRGKDETMRGPAVADVSEVLES